MSAVRLILGSGGQRAPGWTTLDWKAPDADYQVDMTEGLPFRDGEVEMIVAHHCLDLIDACALNDVLAECRRVLEPAGWLRVSLFDIMLAERAQRRGDLLFFTERGYTGRMLDLAFDWLVHLDGARRWITTPYLFASVLEGAGFRAYRESCMHTSGPPDLVAFDSRAAESMFVDAQRGIE